MKISSKSEYGTRAMLDLALNFNKGAVLMKDVAKRQQITFKYLGQLFLLLKAKGLISGKRGSLGGYTLAKNPKEITLLEIFETLEGPISIQNCSSQNHYCNNDGFCVTTHIWSETKDLISHFFKNITLDDLVTRYHEKRSYNCIGKNKIIRSL